MGYPRHRQTLPAVPTPEREDSFPAVDEELLKTLPPVLRAVVRALGFGRAREWLADHGGVNVSIPAYRTQALGLEPDELARLRITLARRNHLSSRQILNICREDDDRQFDLF